MANILKYIDIHIYPHMCVRIRVGMWVLGFLIRYSALCYTRVLSLGIHLAEKHAGIRENIMGINQTKNRINKLGNEIS